MRDVLQEAMDLEGLKEVLAAMHDGRIRCRGGGHDDAVAVCA